MTLHNNNTSEPAFVVGREHFDLRAFLKNNTTIREDHISETPCLRSHHLKKQLKNILSDRTLTVQGILW